MDNKVEEEETVPGRESSRDKGPGVGLAWVAAERKEQFSG